MFTGAANLVTARRNMTTRLATTLPCWWEQNGCRLQHLDLGLGTFEPIAIIAHAFATSPIADAVVARVGDRLERFTPGSGSSSLGTTIDAAATSLIAAGDTLAVATADALELFRISDGASLHEEPGAFDVHLTPGRVLVAREIDCEAPPYKLVVFDPATLSRLAIPGGSSVVLGPDRVRAAGTADGLAFVAAPGSQTPYTPLTPELALVGDWVSLFDAPCVPYLQSERGTGGAITGRGLYCVR